MNNEIKAFLINIKGNEDWKEIYNYITNLQKENQKIIQKYNRLANILFDLEKEINKDWQYYSSISFNTRAEFDDEEQVNRFWQEYGESQIVKKYKDKLSNLESKGE